jgi:cytochrome c oxidase subunit IV
VTALTSTVCDEDYTQECNTTVPYKLIPGLNFTWYVSSDASGSYGLMWNSSSMAVTPPYVVQNLSFGSPALLSAFTSFKLDQDAISSTGSQRPTEPSSVNQCMFAYCLKTYNDVEVRNGETTFGSIGESIMEYSSQQWFSGDTGTGAYFTMQASVDGEVSGPNYTMNYWDHLNLGTYMRDVMNSSVIKSTDTYAPYDGGKMAPTFGLAMWNQDNLTTMVHDIADSMTNSMRTSQNNITTINGTALVLETFIHIEWKWLALPIAVSVLSFVLLVAVMIISTSHNVEGKPHAVPYGILNITDFVLVAWKSSSMPLLFYGLEGWGHEYTHGFRDAGELKQIAKSMKGQILLEGEHRVFVREGFGHTDNSGY